MVARFEGVRNFRPGGKRAERETVGDALGGDQNIRIHAIVLDGKHSTGAGKAGLNFVGNKKNSVLIENLFHLFEVIRWGHDYSTFAHHWLCNKRGNVIGSRKANHIFDCLGTLPSAFLGIVRPL